MNEYIVRVFDTKYSDKGTDTGIWHMGPDRIDLSRKAKQSIMDVYGVREGNRYVARFEKVVMK